MERPCQSSTVTAPDRHVRIIQKAVTLSGNLQPGAILSFGCSTGDEIASLRSLFPAAHITGVDVCTAAVHTAISRFAADSQVRIANHVDIKTQQFSLILCLNVLCRFHNGGEDPERPLPYSLFESAVRDLIALLAPGGVLLVYGANYRVTDVTLNTDFEFIPLNIDSGCVPLYTSQGTVLERAKNWIAIVRRRHQPRSAPVSPPEGSNDAPEGYNDAPEGYNDAPEGYNDAPEGHTEGHTDVPVGHTELPAEARFVPAARPVVTFGIFKYSRSSNSGDYMQTLAQMNVLSVFYHSGWICPSLQVAHVMAKLAESKPARHARNKMAAVQVHLIWVDRDCTHTVDASTLPSTPVHVIANGWYMHPSADGHFQFPFPEWLHPLFVSLHVAQPTLLDSDAVKDYLRRHQPIGCRDRATTQLLRSLHIDAHFTSCLTTTLELPEVAPAQTHFAVDVHPPFCHPDAITRHNIDADMDNADRCIETALRFLLEYAAAESIQSTRIHCVLPVRASSSRPSMRFSSPTGGHDPSWFVRSRFDGIAEIMADPREGNLRALLLFERMVDTVADLLIGASLAPATPRQDLSQFYAAPFDARALRLQHPGVVRLPTQHPLHALGLELCLPTRTTHDPLVRDLVLRRCAYQAFDCTLDIAVTMDTNYLAVARVFLSHLSHANPESLCRVWCITRGVSSAQLQGLHPVPHNVVLLYQPVDHFVFENYTTPLHHVSNVCMDRLLIPKLDFSPYAVNRVLYIDLDVLVLGDLRPLQSLDTGAKGIAAKTSQHKDVINSWLTKHHHLERLYKHNRSFNAGILVMDVDKLQQTHMFEFVMGLYSELRVNDQILLNLYCDGKYREMPPQFNVFVGQDDAKFGLTPNGPGAGAMFHFVGSKKPWLFTQDKYPYNPQLWQLWSRCYPDVDSPLFLKG